MRCPIARSLLDEYIQQTLNPTTMTELEEHLAGCEACSRLLAEKRGSTLPAERSAEKSDAGFAAASQTAPEAAKPKQAATSTETARYAPSADQSSFVPVSQSQAGTEQIRRRLEEMGVVFPEPDRMPRPDVLTPSVQSEDELPLQQLMRRFQPQPQPSDGNNDTHFMPSPPAERPSASAAEQLPLPADAVVTVPVPAVRSSIPDAAESVETAPLQPLTEMQVPKSILIDDENTDKSDDRIWVDIVITHHVTRNQIRKRVRRDSPEAIRYLAENGEEDEDEEPFLRGELAPHPSDAGDAPAASTAEALPVSEGLADLHRPLPQEDAAEAVGAVQSQSSDESEAMSAPIIGDEGEIEMLSAHLPDQDPEQAHVVVVPELVGVEEAPNADSRPVDAHLDSPAKASEPIDPSDPNDPSDPPAEDREAAVLLAGVEPLIFADDADDTDDADELSNEDELQFHLPEGYDPEARPLQRPAVPPTQTNPIVSKPAEMGKERLVRQSRFGRDQEHMIVRDQAAAAPSASFSKMRRLESLRRNPLPLVGLVVALALALIFLVGMLVTAWQSPLAQVHQKLSEDLQLWQQHIDELQNETRSDHAALAYPEPFRFKEESGADSQQLQSQLTDLNRLYRHLQAALTACRQDRQKEELAAEARLFIEAISEPYADLMVELKRASYPRSPSEWQTIQSMQEPVETLALLYERTGSIQPPYRAALWTEEKLRAWIAQLPLAEAAEPIALRRYLSRREDSDIWEIELSVESEALLPDYLLQFDDSSGHLIWLQHQSELTLHLLGRDAESLEALAESLSGGDRRYLYLGERSVDEGEGDADRVAVLAPLENRTFYPEYPLFIQLGSGLELLNIVNTAPRSLQLGAASDPAVDLFQAASLARQFLQGEGAAATDSEGYIADLSQGVLGEPRRAWLYRLKQGGSWQEVLVDGEDCLAVEELLPALLAFYGEALKNGQE